jgi:hypothetical protein
MQVWVNWRTRITHLSRDCHQIQRIPEGTSWLEPEEGEVGELTSVGRRYCSWCVGRYLAAGELLSVVPSADVHPAAERADYVRRPVTPRQ